METIEIVRQNAELFEAAQELAAEALGFVKGSEDPEDHFHEVAEVEGLRIEIGAGFSEDGCWFTLWLTDKNLQLQRWDSEEDFCEAWDLCA